MTLAAIAYGIANGDGLMKLTSNYDVAQGIGIAALSFLAQDADRLARFLGETGITPDGIRSAAEEAGFLAGVLAHVMRDESLLIVFATHAEIDPEHIASAHELLSGPAAPDGGPVSD